MIRRLRESNHKYLKERYGKQPTLKELCKILASIGFEGSFDITKVELLWLNFNKLRI